MVPRRFKEHWLVAHGAAMLLGALGCGSVCQPDAQRLSFEGGVVDEEARMYVSAPWDGPLTAFRAGFEVQFAHRLGVVPESVQTYLSFDAGGLADSDVTQSAGDHGLVRCIDDRVVSIMNNTCQDFFVRVVATASVMGDRSNQRCASP